MNIYSPTISGSLTISGSIITTGGGLPLTGSLVSSGSFTSIGNTIMSGSLTVYTSGNSVEFQVLGTGTQVGNAYTDTHTITGSLAVSGSTSHVGATHQFTGSLLVSGTVNINGDVTASNALYSGNITAQTLVVQTITSSVSFITGSTKFGQLSSNTHVFSGSVTMNPGGLFVSSSGNVGIGTSTPSGKLEIIPAATSGNEGIFINQSGAQQSTIRFKSAHSLDSDYRVGASILVSNAFEIYSVNATTSRFVITNSGSIGIGTTTPNVKFEIGATTLTGAEYSAFTTNQSGGVSSKYSFWRNYSVGGGGPFRAAYIANYNSDDSNNSSNAQFLVFATKSGTAEPVERMRITAAGYTKMSSNGTYASDALYYHEMRQTGADWNLILQNTSATGATRGVYLEYTAYSPNGVANYPYYFTDSTATRFYVASNGGIYNYQSNNSNLSDIRTKKDIAPLESYWNKFKAIEIVKFKYKDQTHNDFNIGVIAQQVEEVAPEFVDVDSWDMEYRLEKKNTEKNSTEEPMKSIYTADLYHATIKVLQEAMAKIETLQTQNDDLQSQINELKNK